MLYITYNIIMFNVLYYQKIDGTRPAEEFVNSTDIKMKAKIYRNLELLEEFGNTLKEPISKPLEDGIFEIRSQIGNDISRVLYFFVIGKTVILTNGFIKKTDKTPQDEIDLAKKYREDYIKRTKKDGDNDEEF